MHECVTRNLKTNVYIYVKVVWGVCVCVFVSVLFGESDNNPIIILLGVWGGGEYNHFVRPQIVHPSDGGGGVGTLL